MKGIVGHTLTVLFVFAAAAACSPRLRRKYQELRLLEQSRANQEAPESNTVGLLPMEDDDVQRPPSSFDTPPGQDRWLGERAVRAAKVPDYPQDRFRRLETPKRLRSDGQLTPEEENSLTGVLSPEEIEAKLASGKFNPATFNPTPYEMNTPEWNMAMINLLLSLKDKGHKINEVEADKPLADIHRELQSSQAAVSSETLVCKTAPYNVCYRLDEDGHLHPIGDRRPVRILRVY